MRTTIATRMRLGLVLPATLSAVSLFAQSSLVDEGRGALDRGDYDKAIEILEKAVAESPKSAEAHYVLASAYGAKTQGSSLFGKARYGPKMKAELETAVALDPAHVQARYMLVQVYAFAPRMMGGSDDKAFEQAKEIKSLDPVVGHRAYASIYTQQKKPDLAKQEYLAAIREQPDSPKAHSFFGQYLVNVEKNYTAAFSEFETALKLDPGYMAAFYHIGRTAAQAGTDLARGEEALRKYLAYTPKPNEPAHANAHYFLGALYEKQGKKAEAQRCYQAALKLNPALKEASEALKRVS